MTKGDVALIVNPNLIRKESGMPGQARHDEGGIGVNDQKWTVTPTIEVAESCRSFFAV